MKKTKIKLNVMEHDSTDGNAKAMELAYSSITKSDMITNILKTELESRLLYHAKWCPCKEDKDKYYLELRLFNEEEEVIKKVSSRTPWEFLDKKTYELSRSSREHMKERELRERRLLRRAIKQSPVSMRMLLNSMEDLIVDEIENRLKKMSDDKLKELLDLQEFDPDKVRRRK